MKDGEEESSKDDCKISEFSNRVWGAVLCNELTNTR